MKTSLSAIILSLALCAGAPANLLPVGKDTEEIMIGVTGFFAAFKGGDFKVTRVTPGTPAEGRLEVGDVLLAVDGESLEVRDPRHPLGFAINAAEGRDGRMKLTVRREGGEKSVVLPLEPIGAYGPTYPANCRKSKRIVDEAAALILGNGGPGAGINGNLEGLFLLSTGEEKYLPAVEKYAVELAGKGCGTSVWNIGYSGIFLGEYYLATGDKRVLPAIKERCEELGRGQYYGAWTHGTNSISPGYVTGGILNAAGDQAFTTLVLARECGVDYDPKTYDNALRFFFHFAGRGGVPYGDHHPELWWGSNGKSGGLAAALSLLPDPKFQGGARVLALSETDSYFLCEGGHGSCFGNQTWRNIVDVLVPEERQDSYWRHKRKMIWFFELSRMPGGGFRTPWFPGHGTIGKEPLYQTGLVGMAYTAQRKNLRICGKPRTKHSVPHRPTAVEKSLPADDFLRTDFIDGVVVDVEPHEIGEVFLSVYDKDGDKLPNNAKASLNDPRKKKMPAEWYFKIMHHYSPTAREWASHGLGFLGEDAVPYIEKALASEDGRLRVAGLDAISCTTGWGIGKTTSNITPDMIRQHFLPQILKPLKDPKAPMWEKRHALMALSCCDGKTIEPHLDVIKPYFASDEWWLRAAAFQTMHPLIQETSTLRGMLPVLLASYDRDDNLPSRRWGATDFFKKAIAKNPGIKDEIVAGMSRSVARIELRDGIRRAIDENNIFETLRYIDMKQHPEHAIQLLPTIERVYPDLEALPACWTIVGARWGNIGLAKAAEKLGKDGAPFIASMKRLRPDLEQRCEKRDRKEKDLRKALATLDETVARWEGEFGTVRVR